MHDWDSCHTYTGVHDWDSCPTFKGLIALPTQQLLRFLPYLNRSVWGSCRTYKGVQDWDSCPTYTGMVDVVLVVRLQAILCCGQHQVVLSLVSVQFLPLGTGAVIRPLGVHTHPITETITLLALIDI